VRRAQSLGGNRMTEKRMPVAERRQETVSEMVGASSRPRADNWPDTGPGVRAVKAG
jgi:hypothetical protein